MESEQASQSKLACTFCQWSLRALGALMDRPNTSFTLPTWCLRCYTALAGLWVVCGHSAVASIRGFRPSFPANIGGKGVRGGSSHQRISGALLFSCWEARPTQKWVRIKQQTCLPILYCIGSWWYWVVLPQGALIWQGLCSSKPRENHGTFAVSCLLQCR